MSSFYHFNVVICYDVWCNYIVGSDKGMYVRCNPNKKNIKYLSYVRGYRDKNGKTKQVTVEKIGDWKDLIKLYDDPIKHFNDIANEREKEIFLENQDSFHFSLNEELEDNTKPNNIGYIF